MTLIATDLDGTIIRSDGTVSQRTIDAFARRVDAGDSLLFVTGRAPSDALQSLPVHLLTGGRMICANGAIEYDALRDEILHVDVIYRDALAHIVALCHRDFPDGRFCLDSIAGTVFETGHPWISLAREGMSPSRPPESIRVFDDVCDSVDSADTMPYKVTFLGGSDFPEEMIAALTPQLDDAVTLTFGSMTDPFFLEIAPRGVTKGTALMRVAASLGINPVDIVAFGDMPNDIPMFEVAGRSYAMGGAYETVIHAATDRTAHVDDDGVARVLESLPSPVAPDDLVAHCG
ncbi:HAD family hydrolase [Paramicrobacterium chengjingii]|uniref:HAD family hydrolase n=1 Tax=Paramicrobacterium chengjingii TaxID=2769067 RepID=A0ABX6YHY4_9MICO|nr:HAD family hydrolase [Microbacterium chengjingii]QPZ38026.1 HAD family hydrolase [Microbacterium chengjingii]